MPALGSVIELGDPWPSGRSFAPNAKSTLPSYNEIATEKFTLAELDEEEQSLERLRRWHREVTLRDVFGVPSALAAGTACAPARPLWRTLPSGGYRALDGE